MATRSQRHFMAGDSLQQAWPQHASNVLRAGVQQCFAHVGQFFARRLETQSQGIHVGLGGRFDATNVVQHPAVTAVTPIGIDHTQFFGDKLAEGIRVRQLLPSDESLESVFSYLVEA